MKDDAIEKLAQLLFDKIMEKQEKADLEYADQITKLMNNGYTISNVQEKYKDELGLNQEERLVGELARLCLLYTSPSPRDGLLSRMPSSA